MPVQPKKAAGGKAPAKGTTPLVLAVENGHFDLANALLEAGAVPEALKTAEQNSPDVGLDDVDWMPTIPEPTIIMCIVDSPAILSDICLAASTSDRVTGALDGICEVAAPRAQ